MFVNLQRNMMFSSRISYSSSKLSFVLLPRLLCIWCPCCDNYVQSNSGIFCYSAADNIGVSSPRQLALFYVMHPSFTELLVPTFRSLWILMAKIPQTATSHCLVKLSPMPYTQGVQTICFFPIQRSPSPSSASIALFHF